MFLPKKAILLIVVFLFSVCVKAQFVNFGTDPARYKWNIIRTPHYNLIYPQGSDSMAYRYASLLEVARPRVEHTIGKSYKMKFPVVLHPGNMLSNGMVSWAPRRMELITTPSPTLYPQSWDKQLVLHESRHIIQTGKIMKGFFRPLYYAFGEQTAGFAALMVPEWFFEGDAVATETALSNSGRGRLPEFNMLYRAHRIAGDFYSLDKWNLGSYKDYTGTYYALGYNMTAYARFRFGADVWDRVTNRYVKRTYHIPPFTKALKHETGVNSQQLFEQTFSFLEKEWKKQENEYIQSGFSPTYLSPATRQYNSYKYPQALNDVTVLAVKSNLRDINALVKIENTREERLTYMGNINSRIILNNNQVYWTEYVSGLRWAHQNYSVLKCYDLETKHISTITPRKRYLTPAIDENGKHAVVSLFSEEGTNHIVLLETETGKEYARYAVPANAFVKELTFADKGNIIAAVVGDRGIDILHLDVHSGEWSKLLEATSANITSLVWKNGKLFFESGLNGTNNIYELDPQTLQYSRLTTARFGVFTPALSSDGKKLLFADFQKDGYHLASVSLDSLVREKADFGQPYRFELAESITQQEQFQLDTAILDTMDIQPKRYNKALHLFKVHSWAPLYYDATDAAKNLTDDFSTIIKPGAMVISQNSLNTTVAQAGWYYKDGYHHGRLSFSYMGWYPVFNLKVDYGSKAFDVSWVNNEKNELVARGKNTNRNLVDAEAIMYIPFNLTNGHYVRGIQPSILYNFTNNRYQQYDSGKYRNFQYVLSELRLYNYRKMSKQDILPRWGYQFRLQHLISPFNSENYGSLYAARLITYFPGIVRNDGLMLRMGYQYQSLDNKHLYLPKHLITEPRGYDYNYITRQQVAFQADYSFKLFTPDLSLGPAIYIQRVRSNVFYDISKNQSKKSASWTTQSSVGADFILDCSLLQATFPISLGCRIVKPIDYGKIKAEALFSISF